MPGTQSMHLFALAHAMVYRVSHSIIFCQFVALYISLKLFSSLRATGATIESAWDQIKTIQTHHLLCVVCWFVSLFLGQMEFAIWNCPVHTYIPASPLVGGRKAWTIKHNWWMRTRMVEVKKCVLTRIPPWSQFDKISFVCLALLCVWSNRAEIFAQIANRIWAFIFFVCSWRSMHVTFSTKIVTNIAFAVSNWHTF